MEPKRDIQRERAELPGSIYLVPDYNSGVHGDWRQWFDKPVPGEDYNPDDVVEYVRVK
ncbi:MAG: hypothetical protein GY941_10790 [Planctomycetes bacterium]|nr:hypothetical protein [Planctomycetota bacterium]